MSKLAGRCQTRMRDDRYLTTTQYCGKGWHGHSTPPARPANSWDYTIVRIRFAAAALLSGLNNKSVRFRRRVVVMGYLWPQGRSTRGLTPAYRVSTGRDKQGYYTFKVEIRVRALEGCSLVNSSALARTIQHSGIRRHRWIITLDGLKATWYHHNHTMYYCGNQINTIV